MHRRAHATLICCLLLAGCAGRPEPEPPPPAASRALAPAELDAIKEKYRSEIPERMAGESLTGLALALVDGQGPLWVEGFGHLDDDASAPVDEDTIFSLQSTSKVVTATAVLTAVRDGLLDLDAPITRYLPWFTVNSRLEEHPERLMTLRLLLSHRAGFTHEAPVGNNFVPGYESFEAHVRSIQDTWLRYPVGSHHAYSNLGVDLAGYILGVVSGQPFPEYVREKVLAPLGMSNSSYDWRTITDTANRAVGHWSVIEEMPVEFALIPSGGLYSSARDMGAFLTFQLDDGRAGGKTLLDSALLDEMRIPGFVEDQDLGYGLGLRRYERSGQPYYHHSGAGFGFKSHFSWYPALGVGIVVLTNSMDQNVVHQLARDLIASVEEIVAPEGSHRSRPFAGLVALEEQPAGAGRLAGLYRGRGSDSFTVTSEAGKMTMEIEGESKDLFFVSGRECFIDWGGGKRELFRFTLDSEGNPRMAIRVRYGWSYDFDHGPDGPPPGPDRPEWEPYLGRYALVMAGSVLQEVVVERENGYLTVDGERLVVEHLPGLFFDVRGEAYDFRQDPPTYANIPLRRLP